MLHPLRPSTPPHPRRRAGLPALLLTCFSLACSSFAFVAATPTHAQGCAGWVDYPAPAPGQAALRAVRSGPGDTAWAVGSTRDTTLNDTFSLIVRWDGASWQRVPSPSPGVYSGGGTTVQLYAVDGVAEDDLWALGTYETIHDAGGGWVGFQTLALHWDGALWSQVDTPHTPAGGTGAFVYGLDPVASDDVWAVGTRVAPEIPTVSNVGLVMHWDGSSWTELPHPPTVSRHRHELYDLEVFAPDDVLVAGGSSTPTGFDPPQVPYVLRWDGQSWSQETIPAPGLQNFVEDMDAVSRDDVWLVGHLWLDGSSLPYLVHWNGTDWQRVEPAFDHPFGELRAVVARATDDVWAVGVYTETPPPAVGRLLVMHWDGDTWRQVPTDPGASDFGTLWDIDAGPDGTLWTVGQSSITQRLCPSAPLLEMPLFADGFESGSLGSWSLVSD